MPPQAPYPSAQTTMPFPQQMPPSAYGAYPPSAGFGQPYPNAGFPQQAQPGGYPPTQPPYQQQAPAGAPMQSPYQQQAPTAGGYAGGFAPQGYPPQQASSGIYPQIPNASGFPPNQPPGAHAMPQQQYQHQQRPYGEAPIQQQYATSAYSQVPQSAAGPIRKVRNYHLVIKKSFIGELRAVNY